MFNQTCEPVHSSPPATLPYRQPYVPPREEVSKRDEVAHRGKLVPKGKGGSWALPPPCALPGAHLQWVAGVSSGSHFS